MRQSDKDEFNRLISDGNGIDVYARILVTQTRADIR